MKVLFLGVGEACDERLPNTSLLIRTGVNGQGSTVLLDCGFTVTHQYWRYAEDPEELDALWVSHFHGDHFFGIPALLLRFWEMKRRKPLMILGQTGVGKLVHDTMELAYPGFLEKLAYALQFLEVEPDTSLEAAGLKWSFAENGHSRRDLAVRIDNGNSSIFYSGDGRPTPASSRLAEGSHLIVHEAFHLEDAVPGHGTVSGCIDFASRAGSLDPGSRASAA